MKDSLMNKVFKPSQEEVIKKAIERAVKLVDLPYRYKDKCFDNFDTGRLHNSSAELIINSLREYVDNFINNRRKNNWIVLIGECGVGKTHLAAAVLKGAAGKQAEYTARRQMNKHYGGDPNQGREFIFITSSDLIQMIKYSYDCDSISERNVLEKYKNCQMLVIDDLGTEKASEWYQEKLFQILNYRHNEMLPTVITSNLNGRELKNQIGKRLFDRIIEVAGNGKNLWKLKAENYRKDKFVAS